MTCSTGAFAAGLALMCPSDGGTYGRTCEQALPSTAAATAATTAPDRADAATQATGRALPASLIRILLLYAGRQPSSGDPCALPRDVAADFGANFVHAAYVRLVRPQRPRQILELLQRGLAIVESKIGRASC